MLPGADPLAGLCSTWTSLKFLSQLEMSFTFIWLPTTSLSWHGRCLVTHRAPSVGVGVDVDEGDGGVAEAAGRAPSAVLGDESEALALAAGGPEAMSAKSPSSSTILHVSLRSVAPLTLLPPESKPHTRKSVFPETDVVTRPPCLLIRSVHSSLSSESRVPVITKVSPDRRFSSEDWGGASFVPRLGGFSSSPPFWLYGFRSEVCSLRVNLFGFSGKDAMAALSRFNPAARNSFGVNSFFFFVVVVLDLSFFSGDKGEASLGNGAVVSVVASEATASSSL